MAWVKKRGERWYTGYRDERGDKVLRVCPATGKREAQALAVELEWKAYRRRAGLDEKTLPKISFGELKKSYLEVQAAGQRSYETIKQRVNQHLSEFDERIASEITPADILGLLNRKATEKGAGNKGTGLSPQTRQHLLNHLCAIYTFGVEVAKVLRVNVAREVEPVEIFKAPPKALEPDQVAPVIMCVEPRWRGFFAVAFYTGLRESEILALEVDAVDLDRRLIEVRASGSGATKDNDVRYVFIPDELVPFLKFELGKVRSKYLFPGLDGKLQSRHCNLPRTFRNAMKKAGIVVGFDHVCRRCKGVEGKAYQPERRADDAVGPCPKCGFSLWPKPVPPDLAFKDCRSTYATSAYEATGDARFVQAALGHGSPRTTDRYVKMRNRQMLLQANKVRFGASVGAELADNRLASPSSQKESGENRGELPPGFPPLTSARGRGLEPLTSGVTGRIERLVPTSTKSYLGAAAGVSSSAAQSALVPDGLQTSPLASNGLTILPGEGLGRALTVREVAAALRCSEPTVRGMIRRGELRAVRFGALVRIREADLEALLKPP